jgi:hypothetical protein
VGNDDQLFHLGDTPCRPYPVWNFPDYLHRELLERSLRRHESLTFPMRPLIKGRRPAKCPISWGKSWGAKKVFGKYAEIVPRRYRRFHPPKNATSCPPTHTWLPRRWTLGAIGGSGHRLIGLERRAKLSSPDNSASLLIFAIASPSMLLEKTRGLT